MASDDVMHCCEAVAPVFSALVRSVAPIPHASVLPSAPSTADSTALSFESMALLYPDVASQLQAQRTRLASILHRTLALAEPGHDASALSPLSTAPRSEDASRAYESVAEALDRLRETAEGFLDEARGQHSSQQVARVQSQLQEAAAMRERAGGGGAVAKNWRRMPVTSANVERKPQDAFHDAPVDNGRDTPFSVKLREKYHALRGDSDVYIPTSLAPVAFVDDGGHPYAAELAAFAASDWQLQRAATPAPFRSLDDVQLTYVDTPAALDDLVRYLDGTNVGGVLDAADRVPMALCVGGAAPVREIAVDLEAHNMRSFQGFTCLMQLSTRSRDYIIDTLALRADMHVLNRVFADPRVVKVLHGCDSDVQWLQRDFGIYLVNVFDTGQAARALGYPSFGLAHLLQHFAGVTANKEYQTADWRERPLPPHLIKYAREDTHYLLSIYDRVKNECIDHVPHTQLTRVLDSTTCRIHNVGVPQTLAVTLARSHSKTLQRYEKEVFAPLGFRRMMAKLNLEKAAGSAISGDDDARQLQPPVTPLACAFAALYEWRDRIARAEDEAPFYILANGKLARLAEVRPTSMDELLRTLTPVPASVRTHAAEVLRVLRESAVYGSRLQAQVYAAAQAAAAAEPAAAVASPPAPPPVRATAGTKRGRVEKDVLSVTASTSAAVGTGAGDDADLVSRKRARPAIAHQSDPSTPLSLIVNAQSITTSVQQSHKPGSAPAASGLFARVADVWMADDNVADASMGMAKRVTAALQGSHIMELLSTLSTFAQLLQMRQRQLLQPANLLLPQLCQSRSRR